MRCLSHLSCVVRRKVSLFVPDVQHNYSTSAARHSAYHQVTIIAPDGVKFPGKYKGELSNTDTKQPHGLGQFIADNGTYVYSGGWINGKRHGRGTYQTFGTGQVKFSAIENKHHIDMSQVQEKYDGEFSNDLRHGQGTCSGQGMLVTGEWKKGDIFNGTVTYVMAGKEHTIIFREGSPV